MKKAILVLILVASVTWGKGAGKASASRANLSKARTVATAKRKASGDSPAQLAAAKSSLITARQAKKMRKAGL